MVKKFEAQKVTKSAKSAKIAGSAGKQLYPISDESESEATGGQVLGHTKKADTIQQSGRKIVVGV